MLLQKRNIRLNRSLLAGAYVRLVVVEVDVLHALREHLLVSNRRGWGRCGWWWRRIHGYARRRRLAPSRAFSGQGVSGGVRWRRLLSSVPLDTSDSITADVGCIGR